ncbi:N-succinylarginine dihydrolase [Porticoccaceae bacterium]|nr:N-succinylarginine dihydrolase [Porticoccaceae bacterium]MDB2634101.1 N-succinylarginine dihydrolase [Porticoccaceae bacterium]MDB2663937.1 N-succinylarginine dihydrolase [Porticoccaceae bacterium]
MSATVEMNFDGLIGSTHNYAGLSEGNLASTNNAKLVSHPRQAAKEGLAKMFRLHQLGLKQGVLLPQERLHMPTLRHLGFTGSDSEVIAKVSSSAPHLLAMCYSASSMWAANAATVSPSADTADGRVHFTPANLKSMFHRSIEAETTSRLLKVIFNNSACFAHHDALRGGVHLGDEGAANHNRLCSNYGDQGVELFVYGRRDFGDSRRDTDFPARQSLEASMAIARRHQLHGDKVVMARQSAKVIDAGGFHNDVVSVSNKNVLFMHELAFQDKADLIDGVTQAFEGQPLHFVQVPDRSVSLENAIQSYLFNSQLVNLPNSEDMTLILPMESRENPAVHNYLLDLVEQETPIKNLEFVDVRQSMRNGGGPACLRLRVVLTEQELARVNANFILDDQLFSRLNRWVDKHYRDELRTSDLADPDLLDESRAALDELTQIMDIGSFYSFQRA